MQYLYLKKIRNFQTKREREIEIETYTERETHTERHIQREIEIDTHKNVIKINT